MVMRSRAIASATRSGNIASRSLISTAREPQRGANSRSIEAM